MDKLTEKETRKKIIDPHLERSGWKVKGSYVKEEINPVKSNFQTKEYVGIEAGIERNVDRFIDYLLLDEDRTPIAIVEAKKTSVSVEKGEIQARTYREDVEKQIGAKIPIFLTNGKVWYYVDDLDRRRKVPLPFSQKDLHRIVSLMKKRKNPVNSKIRGDILDRKRGIEAVKVVLEHISKGHREALINMATGVFKPYAGVSTAVLFFTKTEHEPTEKVWFYKMEADGYSLDDKRTPIDEVNFGDINDILERFDKQFKENNKDRSKKHFFVPFQEIKDNDWDLSINKYREEEEEEINHRESKVVIEEAKKEIKQLLEGFEELEGMIK